MIKESPATLDVTEREELLALRKEAMALRYHAANPHAIQKLKDELGPISLWTKDALELEIRKRAQALVSETVRNEIIEEIAGHTTLRLTASGDHCWLISDLEIRALKNAAPQADNGTRDSSTPTGREDGGSPVSSPAGAAPVSAIEPKLPEEARGDPWAASRLWWEAASPYATPGALKEALSARSDISDKQLVRYLLRSCRDFIANSDQPDWALIDELDAELKTPEKP